MKRPITEMPPIKATVTKAEQLLHDMSDEEVLAQNAYNPAVRALASGKEFSKNITGETDIFASIAVLAAQINEVRTGNLNCAEDTLTMQANTLDMIFNSLAIKAAHSDMLNKYEIFMRLALKAQSQCRTTYEALAEIKNPRPASFIKQQNIGVNQQVNNNDATPLAHEKTINPSNELLEAHHGEWMDTSSTNTTIGANKELETVGAINRCQDSGR